MIEKNLNSTRSLSDSVVPNLRFDKSFGCKASSGHTTSTTSKKNLRWSTALPTILIPSKEEFKKVGCDIWWDQMEIAHFREEAYK
jgi:hypothetical protein